VETLLTKSSASLQNDCAPNVTHSVKHSMNECYRWKRWREFVLCALQSYTSCKQKSRA